MDNLGFESDLHMMEFDMAGMDNVQVELFDLNTSTPQHGALYQPQQQQQQQPLQYQQQPLVQQEEPSPDVLWQMYCSPQAIVTARTQSTHTLHSSLQESLHASGHPCALAFVQDGLGFPVKQRSAFSMTCGLVMNDALFDVQVQVLGDVQIVLVANHLKKTEGTVKFNTAPMVDNVAVFDHLAISIGSRLKEVRVQAVCVVQVGNNAPVEIRSELSQPTIVLTNEKQWATALDKLVGNKLFPDVNSLVEWPLIAREMQHCWIEGTRQSLDNATRPLRFEDFQVLKGMFLPEQAQMDRRTFDEMFEWFGIVLSRIRYGKGIAQLWTEGTLLGFLPKDQSHQILHGQPEGSALLRFSRSAPDRMSLVYVKSGKVHHYLIPHSVCSASSSLATLLFEKAQATALITDEEPANCLKPRQLALQNLRLLFEPPKLPPGEAQLPGYDKDLK